MTPVTRSMFFRLAPTPAVAILVVNSCSSTSLTPGNHDSGSDASVTSGHNSAADSARDSGADRENPSPDASGDGPPSTGGCTGHAPTPEEVPPAHRPAAAACSATSYASAGASCTTASDCPGSLSMSVPPTCFHGQCSLDRCLTDADCAANEICACMANFGGFFPHVNLCVPAACHVDADCGANGFCSPSRGYCGEVAGYYCHGSADTCIDETKDCPGGQTCQYMPTIGGFTCAPPPICAG